MNTTSRLLLHGLAVTALGGASLHAAPLIYESFSQPAGSLGGAAGGTGLNDWSINQTVDVVETPTLSYGDLQHAGGQADFPNGNGVDAWVTTTSVLADNDLLDDGATLWFSMMFLKTSGGGANEWAGFAFGTDRLDAAFNGANMIDGGNGVGFATRSGAVSVGTWSGGGNVTTGGSHSIDLSTSVLIVGKIEWGATAGDDETITLYTPSTTDLGTLGTGVSTTVAGFDQTAFDTISVTQRNSGGTQTYDEIRFGASLDDVLVAAGASGEEPFALTISPAVAPDTGFDLEWESQAGKLYNLRTSADLSGEIATWTLVEGDIAATPPTNTRNVDPGDARRFYAVEKFDAPPLLEEGFEDGDGGFTVATAEGTAWERGTPDSSGLGGTVDAGNDGSANAWATNLGTVSTVGGSPTAVESGFFVDPTNTALRSPVIDLTEVSGAELTFAEAADFPDTDTAVVNLINATTDDVIAQIHVSEDGDISNVPWTGVGPIDLAAGVGQEVRLEWRFDGAGGENDDFMGWYIDDVVVSETTP